MSAVKIEIRSNGPYLVTGPVEIVGPNGDIIGADDPDDRVLLCRCGRSGEKPFCDGAHNRSGWSEAETD